MEKENSSNPESLLPRFIGEMGDSVLGEVLCNQILIRGESSICDEFKQVINLIEVKEGETLIKQGGADNNIYFILSGSFSVVVNGRDVATRLSGQHVGEMSLIDHTARRSASVIALEHSLVASVNEADFSSIANRYPQIWRRIAVELSNRLKQRNRFLDPPRNQPVVFIGSSSESLEIAREIQNSLSNDDFVVQVWSSGIFSPSATPIESLVETVNKSDFGVIIFNPDDIVVSRNEEKTGPRDNVVFELGLFIGHLGRDRTFIVVPRGADIKIPTDLLGVTPLKYVQGPPETLVSRIGPVSNELRNTIKSRGPR
ncbi:MAG: nucleotide-binding protein [Deltaproteobacteria bacterium]|nr:nucleotide-binding protein [Deltaproteobacteria bacterium]